MTHRIASHARRAAGATVLSTLALVATPVRSTAQDVAPARLTLGDAARLAAQRSASTAGAEARSAQAAARVAQRRAELLPTLSTSAQLGARTSNSASLGMDFPTTSGGVPLIDRDGQILGPVHNMDVRARVSQRVLDMPAMLRWRASAADADASRRSAAAVADQAAARGAGAYLDVMRSEARIAARLADSALAADLLDIARQQLRAGVGVALDVTRAQSQLADARARLIATRGLRDVALLTLRRELALTYDAPLSIADSLGEPAAVEGSASADVVVAEALGRRADLRAAVAAEDGARLQVRAARAERLPSLELFGDHGVNGRSTDRLLGTYTYGVQVSLPLFDGLRMESRHAEERARQQEAESRTQDARRQVETGVRTALLSLATAREEVAAVKVRLGLAEQEVAQARERFRTGVSGSSDVIAASITLNGARDLDVDARASYRQAQIALAAARGAVAAMP